MLRNYFWGFAIKILRHSGRLFPYDITVIIATLLNYKIMV